MIIDFESSVEVMTRYKEMPEGFKDIPSVNQSGVDDRDKADRTAENTISIPIFFVRTQKLDIIPFVLNPDPILV